MSFIGDMFGGGGSPSQVIDTTPDTFEQLRGPVSDLLKKLLSGQAPTPANVPAQSGKLAANVTGQEQTFLDMIGKTAGGGANAGAIQNLLGQTIGGDFLKPDSNPFLQQAITAATRPVIDTFKDVVDPGLRSQFTAAGQTIQNEGSSPFAKARSSAVSDLINKVGDISSTISASNFQQERQRQQDAVTQSMHLDSGQLDNLVQGLQASALPRIIEQHGLDKGIELFNQQVSVLLEALRLASAVSSPNVASLPGSPGADVGGTIGGLGELAGGLAALFGK